jgi:deoxyribonuclease V
MLERAGETLPVVLDGEEVAAWVCTRDGVRPLVAHAAWRTDAATAAGVAVRTAVRARTPEPLRRARELARTAREVAG